LVTAPVSTGASLLSSIASAKEDSSLYFDA